MIPPLLPQRAAPLIPRWPASPPAATLKSCSPAPWLPLLHECYDPIGTARRARADVAVPVLPGTRQRPPPAPCNAAGQRATGRPAAAPVGHVLRRVAGRCAADGDHRRPVRVYRPGGSVPRPLVVFPA